MSAGGRGGLVGHGRGAAREGAAREGVIREGVAREGVAREGAARERAAREEGVTREGVSHEDAARDSLTRAGELWRVRPAADGDLDIVAALWHEADALHAALSPGFFRHPDRERGRERAFDALRDAEESGHEVILVAVDAGDGAVGGACHVQIYDTPPGHTLVPQRRGHVETLIVTPSRRRRGCGRALMAAAIAWIRERGATQLLLTVWAGNDDAERFYAALGYRTISQVLGTDL